MEVHKIYLSVLALVMMSSVVAASPTDRELLLRQPDGHVFSACLRGDEFGHVLKTSDGCAIIQEADGFYCYARFDGKGERSSSGYRVGSEAPAEVVAASRQIPYRQIAAMAAEKRLQAFIPDEKPLLKRIMESGTRTRAQGPARKHGLVILAQFKDVPFTYTREDFVNLLTQEGYSRNGATGSAMDYFNDQFEGQVEFSFDVSPIVTLSRDRSHYGGNGASGSDRNAAQMIYDACRAADNDIDFSLYDDDGDSEVDNIFVFYAGADEAQTGEEDYIWSHAWYIRDGAGLSLTLDGKTINRYACTSELSGTEAESRIAAIGTFCHEYTHTFGLPDFYDTDYEGSDGVVSAGLWNSTSLMDAGNYNNDGNTPPNLNAIEREMLGLSEAEMMKEGEYVLEPISENGRFLRLDTETEGEYYLFECRSDKGWDAYLNGGRSAAKGLLVYHIDKSTVRTVFSETYNTATTPYLRWISHNEVNANPEHQCADLVEADGRNDRVTSVSGNLTGIFFPNGSTSFTEDGRPAFTDWEGNGLHLSLINIAMEGDNVRFTVSNSSEALPAATGITTDIFQDAVIISWESNISTSRSACLTGSWDDKEINVEPYSSGKYCITVEGLTPGTQYSISIRFRSESGNEGKVITSAFKTRNMPKSNAYPYIYFPETGKVSTGAFRRGTRLPLRVLNAPDAESVVWKLDGKEISTDKDGYYVLDGNGDLSAEITYADGSKETICRTITLTY